MEKTFTGLGHMSSFSSELSSSFEIGVCDQRSSGFCETVLMRMLA